MDTNQTSGDAQLNVTGETKIVDLGVQQQAHREFDAVNPAIMNRDMVNNAIKQLTSLEESLVANIELYINAAGGEEKVREAVRDGVDTRLPLAEFKLELVRTTRARFQGILDKSLKAVEDFVKVNPEQ